MDLQRQVQQSEINIILNNFVEVSEPKSLPQFCVDGREGDTNGPYLQALGGSLHLVALNWLINSGKADQYQQVQKETFSSLRKKGYRISVHRGSHAHDDKSDCGFADNMGKIISTLGSKGDEIWEMITEAEPDLENDAKTWKKIQNLVVQVETDQLPSGKDLIDNTSSQEGVDLQNLKKDHKEIAAVVNFIRNTTLDVSQNQDTPAFNLDLWFVMDQAKDLNLDQKKSLLLSLGLYVATEMVLVEDKDKQRLPIIVRK